nr:immunoglobulin light chain junction region [Macaca mulatta]
CHQYYSTPHSF